MSETMRQQRDRYLVRSGLSVGAYGARRFHVRIGPLRIPMPNPGLLPLHDLHHVVTGYGTDIVGEAEISVFELRTGPRKPMVALLCAGGILFGLLLSPRRVLRAVRSTRGVRGLYHSTRTYDQLLDASVEEVRRELGIPAAGLAPGQFDQEEPERCSRSFASPPS
ncbi:MAG: hypothetical protein U0166_07085 [Acidobacteriota bacterium]